MWLALYDLMRSFDLSIAVSSSMNDHCSSGDYSSSY
jgi:hypothetical protein